MSEEIARIPPKWFEPERRMVVEGYDSNGNVTSRFEGPTEKELWDRHINNQCHWLCNFCYEEGVAYAKEHGINWPSHEESLDVRSVESSVGNVCSTHQS